MRQLLSAPGHIKHPKKAPLQGLLHPLLAHWPIVWQSHGRGAVPADYGSSEILRPYRSWDFLSAQGACCNFPRRELMKMGCGLFLAPSGGTFPETKKSPVPRVSLRQLDFDLHPCANLPRLQSLPKWDLV